MTAWRRKLQLAVALLFIVLPFLNAQGVQWLYGNLLSFKAGALPLADPLAVAQVAVATGEFTQDMLLGAGLVLLLAAFCGPVFCSWACPFGLLSELLYTGVTQRVKKQQQASILARPTFATRRKLRANGLWVKFFLVLTGLALCLMPEPFLFLNQLSLPGWYSRIWQALALGEYYTVLFGCCLILAVLCAEGFVKQRIWCRYLCPQSVLITLARLLATRSLGVVFQAKQCQCKAYAPCNQACSLALDPRSHKLGQQLACTNCGQCIETCAKYGNALAFARQPAAYSKAKE